MRKKLIIAAVIGVIASLSLAAPAQAHGWSHHHSHPGFAVVSVLHAVPNTPVDVYVNHHRLLKNFLPGTTAGPVTLKSGTYVVAITGANSRDDNAPVIGPVSLTFARGGNYTIVAHLTATGAPTATLFKNDTSPSPRGDGRLIVRHTAAAPAVDILANGSVAVAGLTNPNQAALNLPAGTYSAAVALAGSTAPVIGPADVKVSKGKDTIVYAWGSASAGNLALAVQTVSQSYCGW